MTTSDLLNNTGYDNVSDTAITSKPMGFYPYNSTSIAFHTGTAYKPGLDLRLIYTIATSIGLFDNLIVIVVIASSKKLRERFTNIYILNQSCIDFLASLILLLTYRLPRYSFSENIISTFICKASY